jgi:hypothetical protein
MHVQNKTVFQWKHMCTPSGNGLVTKYRYFIDFFFRSFIFSCDDRQVFEMGVNCVFRDDSSAMFVLNLIYEIIFWTSFAHLVLVSIGHYCCCTLKTFRLLAGNFYFFFFCLIVACAFGVFLLLWWKLIFVLWKLNVMECAMFVVHNEYPQLQQRSRFLLQMHFWLGLLFVGNLCKSFSFCWQHLEVTEYVW